jgi:hypothetical protein
MANRFCSCAVLNLRIICRGLADPLFSAEEEGAPLRSVTAPTANHDIRKDCQDKKSIEEAFIGEGTRQFSQTNYTPLMQQNFVQRIG